jgi:hypothetical protein
MPRIFVALTAIVAIAAISLAIKDYVQQNNAPAASTNSVTVVAPEPTTAPQKSTPKKTKRARSSPTEANPTEEARAAADEVEKPLVGDELGNARANAIDGEETSNSAKAQAVDNEPDLPACNTAKPLLPPSESLPLPNMTKPGDVDAPYYQNWAREYWCYDSIQPTADPSR